MSLVSSQYNAIKEAASNQSITELSETVYYANRIAGLGLTENIKEKYLKRSDKLGEPANALLSISNGFRHIIMETNESSEQMTIASIRGLILL